MDRPEPLKHTMKQWGALLSDLESLRTLEEANLTALIATADRLHDIGVILMDIQARLTRIDIWIEATQPSYRAANRRPSDDDDDQDRQTIRALRKGGVRVQ